MNIKKGADVLGNEIKAGDYIVYGAAKGRCAGLNIGRIISNTPERGIKAAVIQVSFNKYLHPSKEWFSDKPKKPRVSTLSFPERICVIPATSVQEALKEMLDYS